MRNALIIGLVFLSSICLSQEIQLTQQLLNPSNKFVVLSGYHGALQTNSIIQSSLPFDDSKGVRANVGVDGYIHNIRSGIGLNLSRDQHGTGYFEDTEFEIHFAPKFKLSDQIFLLTGVALNLNSSQNNLFSRIDPGYSDPRFEKVRNVAKWVNASVGAGLILHQFMILVESRYATNSKAQQSYYDEYNPKLGRQFSFYLSNRFQLSTSFSVSPLVELKFNDDRSSILEKGLGVNTTFYNFHAGLKYLLYEGVTAQIGYNIKNFIVLSYAFHSDTYSLNTQKLNAHEFGIRATLFKNKAKKVYYHNLGLL